MYYVSAQGVDERMINVHYYHYYLIKRGQLHIYIYKAMEVYASFTLESHKFGVLAFRVAHMSFLVSWRFGLNKKYFIYSNTLTTEQLGRAKS